MTDRKSLYTGLSQAAWGYFFLCIDINFGPVNILPAFVGYFLILYSINNLSIQRRDLALLRPLAIFLAVWSLINWVLPWIGLSLDGRYLFLDLLVLAASLYLHYQFLTDIASLIELTSTPESALAKSILQWRVAYVVFQTICVLLVRLSPVGTDQFTWPALAMVVASVIISLALMYSLFQLRRCFDTGAKQET